MAKSSADEKGLFEKLSRRYRTPEQVQKFLRKEFPYNFEKGGETLRSAVGALRTGHAHCLEASFVAAAILEKHGYPPLVMSLESADDLDHVVYIFRGPRGWGAIGQSREPGLHGREPRYRSIRELALSYFDPFVDKTGALIGYGTASLDDSGSDWRFAKTNVWRVEQYLIEIPHQRLRKTPTMRKRVKKLREEYYARGPITSGKFWW
jgi:hypothetical protein